MSVSRKFADARKIHQLRRLQATEALMKLQAADREERLRIEAETEARCLVQAAASAWQDYLSEGVFRPDFASALASEIFVADGHADAAASSRQEASRQREIASASLGRAQSIEDAARQFAKQAGRKVLHVREERQLARIEETFGQAGGALE